MKIFFDIILDYSGPGALLTLLAIWLYVIIKEQKFFNLEYAVYFPSILKAYKEITIKENGRVGWLYYLFITLIILTIISFVYTSF